MLHFYEIADNNLTDCILELTKLKYVINISILMMKSHFHIHETIYNL